MGGHGSLMGSLREVTISVRHRGEPESDVSARHPEVTLRSVSSMTGRMEERKRIIEVSGPAGAIEPFIEDFRETDPVVDAVPITPIDSSPVYVALTFNAAKWDSISELLSDMGIHYGTGTRIRAGWERWTLYLDDGDDLREIIDVIERAGNDTDLLRDVELAEFDPPAREVPDTLGSLTPCQRAVLEAAIELGYYGPDSDAAIEDIGDELDIASTTAWEHLTRAERKVMDAIGRHL